MTERDQESVDLFREYIEDAVATDERYGPAVRHDTENESMLITRFEAGPGCWFIMAINPSVPKVRVGFLIDDPAVYDEIRQWLDEMDEPVEAVLAASFAEAGLDWTDPPVEGACEIGACSCFNTPLELEDALDFDGEQVRNKVLRMLEGYLIAFGPAVIVAEPEDFEEEDE